MLWEQVWSLLPSVIPCSLTAYTMQKTPRRLPSQVYHKILLRSEILSVHGGDTISFVDTNKYCVGKTFKGECAHLISMLTWIMQDNK